MDEFTHIEDEKASMVDISTKDTVDRQAIASGEIQVEATTAAAIEAGEVAKGNVFAVARVAAIQAVKRTWDDIPLCHQIPITDIDIDFSVTDQAIKATVSVRSSGKTGVEMEALNGVSRALLTVWDMVKANEKDGSGQYPTTQIQHLRVEEKHKDKPE